ncbi:MAG TPA: hypothetical protein VG839_05840 [Asticcacaulis sp.]|nr:hypothetical protein [Asticcacaulis sp.]
MLKMQAWLAVAALAVMPTIACAQAEVASGADPKPAETSIDGEPAVADGLMPQTAGDGPSADETPQARQVLRLDDVRLVYAPPPSRYQPEGDNAITSDKTVDVACVIGGDGRMRDCGVASDTPQDPKVAQLALDDVSQFVVAPTARDGTSSAGQTLVISCQFKPLAADGREALASN